MKLDELPIYCINLDRRVDRWKRMQSRFSDDNLRQVERFSAVTPEDPRTEAMVKTLGTRLIAACALSHRDVWKLIKERGQSRALILEDDVFFHSEWKDILQGAMNALDHSSQGWDLFLLNGTGYHAWEEGVRPCNPPLLLAGAYVIHRNAIDALLNDCECMAADYMLVWLQEKRKRSYFHFPYLALQEFLDSDVGGYEQSHVHSLRKWFREKYQPHFGHLYRETFA